MDNFLFIYLFFQRPLQVKWTEKLSTLLFAYVTTSVNIFVCIALKFTVNFWSSQFEKWRRKKTTHNYEYLRASERVSLCGRHMNEEKQRQEADTHTHTHKNVKCTHHLKECGQRKHINTVCFARHFSLVFYASFIFEWRKVEIHFPAIKQSKNSVDLLNRVRG